MIFSTRTRSSLLALTFVPLALVGCHGGDQEDPAAAAKILEQALAPQEVQLVSPESRQEQPTLKLVGEIRAFETVSISSEVVGNIDRVLVEVGDRVDKGTPLVEVDRTTFKLRLAQAEANVAAATAELNLAAKELARKHDLLSDQTIAQAVYDQAEAAQALGEARVGAAVAARDLAQRDYDRSEVRAPAAGLVARRQAVAGQWADINAPLVDLATGSSVKVAARVPESWAPQLSGLDGFDFTVGTSGTSYRAKLFSVEPVVSQASRSFEVVGTFRVGDAELRPGMFANVELVSPEVRSTMWIPATAVATSDMPQVMLVEDDKIVIRRVQTGRRNNGEIEIVTGLASDEQVVLDVSGLGRGTPVTVVGGESNS